MPSAFASSTFIYSAIRISLSENTQRLNSIRVFGQFTEVSLDCSVQRLIWNAEVPFLARRECIRSMTHLFKQLFATEPLDGSVFMWWDSLCYEWHCGNRDRQRGGEDMSMQDVMFEVLAELLQNDSEICQDAALHGLGHLHHPATQELIENYITQHDSLTDKRRQYALAAARFEIQ